MTWPLSPELREALVDALADALIAYCDRHGAGTGVTPTGNARTAADASGAEGLGGSPGGSPVAPAASRQAGGHGKRRGPRVTPAPAACSPLGRGEQGLAASGEAPQRTGESHA